MATISSLSPELLEQIFGYVAGDSDKFKYLQLSCTSEIFDTRSPTQSLLLVSNSFHASAQRLHNRHKHLTLRDESGDGDTQKTLQFISELLHDSSKVDVLRSIRDITVTCELYSKRRGVAPAEPVEESTYNHYVHQLTTLISKIPKLSNLTFKGDRPIPMSLLHILERHQPQCHLHIRNWHRKSADMDHNDPAEIALAHSPNLRSLTAELWGDGNVGLDLRKYALKRIVLLSPHLESVDIKEGTFGCLWRSYSPQERAEMDRLGALFTTSTPSQNNIKSLTSRGGDHVKMLEDVTDMRKLESLEIGWIPNFDYFCPQTREPRFKSLKHLAVDMGNWYDPRTFLPETYLRDFLAICAPLKSLKITNQRGRVDLSIILDNHCHSLRKLHLHESEPTHTDDNSSCHFLSLDQIREVRKRCPELREFTVDLERVSYPGSMREILTELARFEKLEKPTLYFPLDLSGMAPVSSQPVEEPRLPGFRYALPSDHVPAEPFDRKYTSTWLENTYSFVLYQRKVNQLPPFKEICVKLGHWEREPPMGLPSEWEVREGRYKRCFVLKHRERDDMSDKTEIRILRLEDIYDENSVKEEREIRRVVSGSEL